MAERLPWTAASKAIAAVFAVSRILGHKFPWVIIRVSQCPHMLGSAKRLLDFVLSHPLTRDHPTSAVARVARWQFQSRLQRDVTFNWLGGSRLIIRRGMTGATGNIYVGLHEFHEMSFILHLLRQDDLFADAGANVGSYTVL